jgi:type II secretory pathway predicted ATPase ExeA
MRGQIARATPPRWTASQESAVAKLAYAAEHPGCVALLCGPAGVGKTMLLGHLARTGIPGVRGIRVCDLGQSQTHHDAVPGSDGAADVILVDHADRTTAVELVAFVESWWARDPGSVIVLAGQGRLLSLCLGDDRLERRVRLRATVPVFTVTESRRLLASVLGGLATACADDVFDAIHEIAGGAPATALRLADMAAVLAAADPDRRLVPDDIEAIHRRLCIRAA